VRLGQKQQLHCSGGDGNGDSGGVGGKSDGGGGGGGGDCNCDGGGSSAKATARAAVAAAASSGSIMAQLWQRWPQQTDVSQFSVRYEYLLWARPAKARR